MMMVAPVVMVVVPTVVMMIAALVMPARMTMGMLNGLCQTRFRVGRLGRQRRGLRREGGSRQCHGATDNRSQDILFHGFSLTLPQRFQMHCPAFRFNEQARTSAERRRLVIATNKRGRVAPGARPVFLELRMNRRCFSGTSD